MNSFCTFIFENLDHYLRLYKKQICDSVNLDALAYQNNRTMFTDLLSTWYFVAIGCCDICVFCMLFFWYAGIDTCAAFVIHLQLWRLKHLWSAHKICGFKFPCAFSAETAGSWRVSENPEHFKRIRIVSRIDFHLISAWSSSFSFFTDRSIGFIYATTNWLF